MYLLANLMNTLWSKFEAGRRLILFRDGWEPAVCLIECLIAIPDVGVKQ